MAEKLSERVRLRLREEMARQDISQRHVAQILKSNQSRISKLLNGRVAFNLDDLESFCFVLGIPPTEAVRDLGMEFCAEMTPTELRFLEQIRKVPKDILPGVLWMFDVRTKTTKPDRHAGRLVDKKLTHR